MAPLRFCYNSLQDGYQDICRTVLEEGHPVSPRGRETREILNPTITINYPADCLPLYVGRRVSLAVAAVEAVQLCGAFSSPELTVAASENFQKVREDSGEFHGAYGNRIGGQLTEVFAKLREDPDSRQGVAVLWNQHLDNEPFKRDYPCTVSLQFLIRNDRLLLSTNMRSNDAWLGLAYDLFQFGQLQWTLANMLGIAAGPLTHRPVSLHVYREDWDAVYGLHPATARAPCIYGFRDVQHARNVGQLLNGDTPRDNWTYDERWYVEKLAPLYEKLGSGRLEE